MNRRGFTLIETSIAILALVTAIYIGTASFLHLLPKYRLQGAVWEVTARLNEARLTALLEGASVRWRVLPSGDSKSGYALEKFDAENGSWRRLLFRRPPGVTLRANNAPVFHPRGTVSSLATIIIGNSRGTYRITLAITGRIKIVKT